MKNTIFRFLIWPLFLLIAISCLSGCATTKSLDSSAAIGDVEAVRSALKEGADINEKSNQGSTPLHFAARTDRENITRFLLDNGADVHAKDDLG